MSLRTWWLENKLRGIDRKLRHLRFAQKRIRDKERALVEARRAGISPEASDAQEAKLQAERDRLARAIAALMDEEQRIKRELRRSGVSLASH